jgi:hypothetical protein
MVFAALFCVTPAKRCSTRGWGLLQRSPSLRSRAHPRRAVRLSSLVISRHASVHVDLDSGRHCQPRDGALSRRGGARSAYKLELGAAAASACRSGLSLPQRPQPAGRLSACQAGGCSGAQPVRHSETRVGPTRAQHLLSLAGDLLLPLLNSVPSTATMLSTACSARRASWQSAGWLRLRQQQQMVPRQPSERGALGSPQPAGCKLPAATATAVAPAARPGRQPPAFAA